MSALTHETAPTLFVQAGGTRFAYRRFGRTGDAPLLLLNYLAANMDDWDPTVTNGLAVEHDVILFDYPGIGGSSGETPSTVAALAQACVALCQALKVTHFDVMGYSLGGMIAQQLGFEYASMVRRILLLGTAPRGGEELTFTDLSADELDNLEGLVLNALFSPSETSQAAGRAYLERLKQRVADRDKRVSKDSVSAEIAALREWGVVPSTNRFAMLPQIRQTTLIVHGNKDVVVMPINALLLVQHLPNAQLIMYPDASHAAFSQHAETFLQHVQLFFQGSAVRAASRS
jgi:pimeloyl-ACP methyl ester carboxylesterase